MFHSQCLVLRRGPLGAIWVAAYCLKKLNKTLVSQTNIPFSVDKILHDEFDATTYRVLAYLLLGVVRIYSKKVDYLFDDCHETLLQMKYFAVDKIDKESVDTDTSRAPYHVITLPERFELDAFDLEILEDSDVGNVLPQKEILLKDRLQTTEGRGSYFLDGLFDFLQYHSEEFSDCHDTSSVDHLVCSSYYMDINMEASTKSLRNLVEKFQGDCSRDENVNLEKVSRIDNEPSTENQSTHDMHTEIPEMAESVKQMHEGSTSGNFEEILIPPEEPVSNNTELFQEAVKETQGPVNKPTLKDRLTDGECIDEFPDNTEPDIEMHETVNEDDRADVGHALRNTQTNIEKRVDKGCLEDMDIEENLPEIIIPFGEDPHREKLKNLETTKDPQMTPSEKISGNLRADNRLSIKVDSTPQSKLSGAHKRKVTAVRTPAIEEHPRLSKKRKCLLDDVVVIPNDLIRRSIKDASDLVRERRKVPTTTLASWRARQIPNLPHVFSEPVIPFISSELRSLFTEKRFSTIKSNEFVASQKNSGASKTHADVSEASNLDRSLENDMVSPERNPMVGREKMVSSSENDMPAPRERMMIGPHSAGEAVFSETPIQGDSSLPLLNLDTSSDYTTIAPETPTRISGPSMRMFDNPDSPKPSNSNLERDETMSNDKQLALTLIDEMVFPRKQGKTLVPKVADHLDKCFLKQNKGEETVNVIQLVGGKTKKESASFFYEILVLAGKGYAKVKQDEAYGDILVRKLPRWENIWSR
ncbi:hypothetical protein ACFE04_009087 [Oxalis oulophora]